MANVQIPPFESSELHSYSPSDKSLSQSLSQSQKKRGRRPKSHQYASGTEGDVHEAQDQPQVEATTQVEGFFAKSETEAEANADTEAEYPMPMEKEKEKEDESLKAVKKTIKRTGKTTQKERGKLRKGSLSKSVSASGLDDMCHLEDLDMDAHGETGETGEAGDADLHTFTSPTVLMGSNGEGALAAKSSKKSRKNTKVVYNTMEAAAIATDDDHVIIKLNIKESMISENIDAAKGNAGGEHTLDGLYAYNASYNTFESKPFEISSFGDTGLFPLPMATPEMPSLPVMPVMPVMPMPLSASDMDAQGQGLGQDAAPGPNESNPAVSALKVIHLLREFEHKNMNNEWPASTSIHCYWCCHKFDGPPFGIPVKLYKDKFYVTGCFCSLECAAAYNFESKDGLQQKFEQYHLMNAIARKIGYSHDVKRAPSRLALKMFGGHLSIEQFRGFCHTSKLININFPPMMTLTQQLEEINQSDLDNDYKYVPIDTDRVNKYKEKIKLKRSKPLTNFKNTLDHTMNLKIAPSSASQATA